MKIHVILVLIATVQICCTLGLHQVHVLHDVLHDVQSQTCMPLSGCLQAGIALLETCLMKPLALEP